MPRSYLKAALLFPLLSLMLVPAALAGSIGPFLVASTTPTDGITGYAFDPASGSLYTSTDFGQTIIGPGGSFSVSTVGSLLDMAFAQGYIWAGEGNAAGGVSLARIDPNTGAVMNEYDLGSETLGGNIIPFMASGVAWDGAGLWVGNNAYSGDELAAGIYGTSIERFTWDSGLDALTLSGSAFTPWPDTFGVLGAVVTTGRTPGGLAWNTATNRLMIGTDSGDIFSYNPGNPSGGVTFYANTGDGGFVQGLEEEVPEPASFLLLGPALAGCLWVYRRRSAR